MLFLSKLSQLPPFQVKYKKSSLKEVQFLMKLKSMHFNEDNFGVLLYFAAKDRYVADWLFSFGNWFQ